MIKLYAFDAFDVEWMLRVYEGVVCWERVINCQPIDKGKSNRPRIALRTAPSSESGITLYLSPLSK